MGKADQIRHRNRLILFIFMVTFRLPYLPRRHRERRSDEGAPIGPGKFALSAASHEFFLKKHGERIFNARGLSCSRLARNPFGVGAGEGGYSVVHQ